MITVLQGEIISVEGPYVSLLLAHGMGYEVEMPASHIVQLPPVGKQIRLHTHLVVREDAQLLYAFNDKITRDIFRDLIKASGVGPKLGLTILSQLSPVLLLQCLQRQDVSGLVQVKGVGAKLAERLLMELRGRITQWQVMLGDSADQVSTAAGQAEAIDDSPHAQDAIAALVKLGYKPQLAQRMIAKIDDTRASREELIRLALQQAD